MVKKSIIAIAVICMLATVTFAQDSIGGAFKTDTHWPCICEYDEVTLCIVPVYLKVGMFVKVECPEKVVLSQVDCSSIGKDITKDFPCYKGCSKDFKVMSNFEVQLKCKFSKSSDIIEKNSYVKCYFDDGVNPPADTYTFTGTATLKLCVEAWKVNTFNGTPGEEPQVGSVTITALPTGTPECAG
jgi:hypothetical protein